MALHAYNPCLRRGNEISKVRPVCKQSRFPTAVGLIAFGRVSAKPKRWVCSAHPGIWLEQGGRLIVADSLKPSQAHTQVTRQFR
jgi:hypothetical protein